jgi:hypothetical protein
MNTGWKIYLAGYLVAFVYNIYISVKCNKEDIDNEPVDNDDNEPIDGELFWGGTHEPIDNNDPVENEFINDNIYESIYDISITEIIMSLLFSLFSWVAVFALWVGQNITFTVINDNDDIIINDKNGNEDIDNKEDDIDNDKENNNDNVINDENNIFDK